MMLCGGIPKEIFGIMKVVVVDESHTLRTTDKATGSKNTEAAIAAVKAAKRAVLLTGTPSLSRPYDLFRQVHHALCCCFPKTCMSFIVIDVMSFLSLKMPTSWRTPLSDTCSSICSFEYAFHISGLCQMLVPCCCRWMR